MTEALVVAGSDGSLITRGHNLGAGWVTESVVEYTDSAPALSFSTTGAVLSVRSLSNVVRYCTFTAGNWTAFSDVGNNSLTRGQPGLAASSGGAHHLVFQGEDYKYYSSQFGGASWTLPASVGTPQAFGPLAPAIAARGAGYAIAYRGDNGRLITQNFSGAWDGGVDHGAGSEVGNIPPAVAGRAAGFVVVFAPVDAQQALKWTAGLNSASWSAPASLPGPVTDRAFAVTATSTGDVVAAWVGRDDQKLYAAVLSAGSWSSSVEVDAFSQAGPPALAPGVGTNRAELVFLRGNAMQHASLVGSDWTPPEPIASGDFKSVALARAPR